MPTYAIVLLIIFAILAIALIALYFWGKKAEATRAKQQTQIDAAAQSVSMLIIDKKMMRLKDAGLPDIVMQQASWYMKRAKIPVVKAKIGPKVMTLIADVQIYDDIPVKKEVKAMVSGIYITSVKGLRKDTNKVPEKKGFFSRFKRK